MAIMDLQLSSTSHLSRATRSYYDSMRPAYLDAMNAFMSVDYMSSPRVLSIETYVKCNATCEFCPYTSSSRIGQRMDTALVYKIIDEVASGPKHPELFIPCRLNEPLLDKRLFDICAYALKKMPHTKVGYFTNGTTMNLKNAGRILASENLGYINVSLNSHIAEEHRKLMGIDFALVHRNLVHMHDEVERSGSKAVVNLTRVGDGTDRDMDYLAWCTSEFPLFYGRLMPRFDWLGKTFSLETGGSPLGCTQWFQLHFLADGREAFCCVDDDGRFGCGDANLLHALEIYNHPVRSMLRRVKSRKAHDACRDCNAWL